MAGSNRVTSLRFHQFDFSFLGAINRRRAERAVVVVQAGAAQFDRLTIQFETFATLKWISRMPKLVVL